MDTVPIIDLEDRQAARLIDAACRRYGFFAVANHGVSEQRRLSLLEVSQQFFNLPSEVKSRVSLAHGGSSWRGWFPLGDELTSGIPDLKEGYYVGSDLPPDTRPLHGPNLWPAQPPGFRREVSSWIATVAELGHRLLSLMAVGLGLDARFFADGLTKEPTELFRIFRYPPHPAGGGADRWGVAEHTDYGLLTLLVHDGAGGLEIKVGDAWIPAPSDPALIICNLGDMLDRLTAGRYRSTPHRVRNQADRDRYSFPFFLDPGWEAIVEPIAIADGWSAPAAAVARWDRTNLQQISGTYGQWLGAKVSKVFPALAEAVLPD